LRLAANRREQSCVTRSRCRRHGQPGMWRRHAAMVGRETVPFSQARNMLLLLERGAACSGAMKSVRVAEEIAARKMASEGLRAQGESR
jgi:hypothetical protein